VNGAATIENPYASVLWAYNGFQQLIANHAADLNSVDYCMFGRAYKKPTKIVSFNLPMPSTNLRCDRSHVHVRLSGWRSHPDEVTIPTGNGSAEYPDELCCRWAQDVSNGIIGK